MSVNGLTSSFSSSSAHLGEVGESRSNFVSEFSSGSARLSQEVSSEQTARVEATARKSLAQEDEEIPEGKQQADAVDSSEELEAEMPEEFEWDEDECFEEERAPVDPNERLSAMARNMIVSHIALADQLKAEKRHDEAARLREKMERLRGFMENPGSCVASPNASQFELNQNKKYRASFIQKLVQNIMNFEREDRLNACAIFLSKIPMSGQEVSCFLGRLEEIEEESMPGSCGIIDYRQVAWSYPQIPKYQKVSKERQAEMDKFLTDAAHRAALKRREALRGQGPLTKEELQRLCPR